MLIVVGTKPHGGPEAVARNGIKRGKPEHLIGKTRGRGTERSHPALAIHDCEHPKLGRAESFCEVSREGVPQIGLDLCFPDRKSFMPQIDLDECGKCLVRCANFDIAIRNEAGTGLKRFVEAQPSQELRLGGGIGRYFRRQFISLMDS